MNIEKGDNTLISSISSGTVSASTTSSSTPLSTLVWLDPNPENNADVINRICRLNATVHVVTVASSAELRAYLHVSGRK